MTRQSSTSLETGDFCISGDGDDLAALVRLLQAHTPLERLSNMEARTVFEFMAQRGYKVHRSV